MRLRPLQAIDEPNRVIGGTDTDGCFQRIAAVAAGSRVDDSQRAARRIREVSARTTAEIRHSFFAQSLNRGVVFGAADALPDDFAIPLESVSVERSNNGVAGAGLFARRINILDAHQPFALLAACLKVAGYGCQ